MNIGTATSEENPTHVYFGTRGFWITYTIILLFCHLLLLSMPFFSVAVAWTVTCVFHSVVRHIITLFLYILMRLFISLKSKEQIFVSCDRRVVVYICI